MARSTTITAHGISTVLHLSFWCDYTYGRAKYQKARLANAESLVCPIHDRPNYGFRGWIGRGRFPVERGRYHLYVGNTCPWCHRAVLAVVLRELAPGVTFSYMDDSECNSLRVYALMSRFRSLLESQGHHNTLYLVNRVSSVSGVSSGTVVAPFVFDRSETIGTFRCCAKTAHTRAHTQMPPFCPVTRSRQGIAGRVGLCSR